MGYEEDFDVVKEIKDGEGRITEYTTVWKMDDKTCEVVFDQENNIPYIAKYIEYKDLEDKLTVELYNPMTGEPVNLGNNGTNPFKLLTKDLD